MSFNWLLIWTVTISCAFMLFSLLRLHVRALIHYLPVFLVFTCMLIFYQRDKENAGYYAGGAWFLLILLPGITSQISNSLLAAKRYLSASLVARIAWIVRPWGGTRDQPLLVKAIWNLNRGNTETAISLLETLRLRNSPAGRTAHVILTRWQGQWGEFLNSILHSPNPRKVLSDPLFANTYLQALGETGQTERLVEDFNRLYKDRRGPSSSVMLNIARLKVAAFCGRTDLVAILLDGPLGYLEPATQRFWLATSMQAAGRADAAKSIFAELSEDQDRQISASATRRLQQPVRSQFDVSSPQTSKALVEIQRSVAHENRFALMNSIATVRPIATYGLLALLAAMFLGEMFNGDAGRIVQQSTTISLFEKGKLLLENTTSNKNLIDMGALVLPTSLYPDPLWRVFRAAFLHFGILHLLMNMAGLWIFGQRLEEAWGALLTCIAYLVCAVFSIYLMTIIPLGATVEEPHVLIGASGGVMGLIGCLLGYLGWGQLLQRNQLVGKEFNLLFVIVMVQMIFDRNTPEVSSECHLLGLAIGVTIGFSVGVIKSLRHRFRKHRTSKQPVLPSQA